MEFWNTDPECSPGMEHLNFSFLEHQQFSGSILFIFRGVESESLRFQTRPMGGVGYT